MIGPWTALAGFLALTGALAGSYVAGRRDGAAIVRGGELEAARLGQELADHKQADVDAGATEHQVQQQARQEGVREIWHETERYVDRPVYSAVGIDADGVRSLDGAAALANGEGQSGAARATAGVADGATIDGRQCLASLLDLYDVAGGIRSNFLELQAEVKKGATAAPAPAQEGKR